MNVIKFFSWTFALLRFNKKTVNNQTLLKCGLLMTSQSLQPFAFQIAVYLTLFYIGF